MISVSSAASTLLNSDQIAKANQSQQASQSEERRETSSEENREGRFTDVTSFSPEGLALAQQVNSPSHVAEQQQTEPQENEQSSEVKPAYQGLDVRA